LNASLYVGDVFIAFTSVSCKFLAEIHAGDTLYPQLEIIDLAPHGDAGQVTTRATIHNQHGQLVLDGERRDEFGPNPEGYLCYNPAGIVSATLGDSARPPVPASDPQSGTSEDYEEMARHFIAYAGPFSADAATGPSPITSTSRCSRTGKAKRKAGGSPSRADG
jgi:Lipocalin-like domain